MRRREDDLLAWGDDPLVQALRSPGTPEELAGAEAPAALFRELHGRRSRRRLVGHVGTAVTTVVVVLGLSGGVAAAYDRVLPDPLQSAMHALLGPVGVPDTPPPHPTAATAPAFLGRKRHHHARPANPTRPPAVTPTATTIRPPAAVAPTAPAAPPTASSSVAPTAATTVPSASAAPIQTATTAASPSATSPTSPPPAPATLTAIAGRTRVPADQRTTMHGRLHTASGAPVADNWVYLQARDPGSNTWVRVAAARTAADGTVALRSPQLTHNVTLRLTTPQNVHSDSIAITELPQITTSIAMSSDHKRYVVAVSVAGAHSGDDVALARQGSDGWTTVHRVQLPDSMQVTWSVPVPAANEVHYRVRVPGTGEHGEADTYFSVGRRTR